MSLPIEDALVDIEPPCYLCPPLPICFETNTGVSYFNNEKPCWAAVVELYWIKDIIFLN